MAAGSSTPHGRVRRVAPTDVTADALREGDPLVLAALVEQRGPAVMAYAEAVAAPDGALRMAAAVFAEHRVALLADHASDDDLDAALLAATRRVAARSAENPFRPDAHPRPAERTPICDRFPRLLTTWADHRLPRQDADRLREHVVDCPDCDALNVAFDRAETAYAADPTGGLAPEQTGAIVAAMALASAG